MSDLTLKQPTHHELVKFDALIKAAQKVPTQTCAVAHPCDETSLSAVVQAHALNIIDPIFIGPRHKIEQVAKAAALNITGFKIIDVPHSHAAAAEAVAQVRAGNASLLMKGSLHTDELMHEVVNPQTGLRTARRLSHVFLMDVPTYAELLFITDAAINIAPDLLCKADIVQNAIDLHLALGFGTPRVAILSAVESARSAASSLFTSSTLLVLHGLTQLLVRLLSQRSASRRKRWKRWFQGL